MDGLATLRHIKHPDMGLLHGQAHLLGQPAISRVAAAAETAPLPQGGENGVGPLFPVAELRVGQPAQGLVVPL